MDHMMALLAMRGDMNTAQATKVRRYIMQSCIILSLWKAVMTIITIIIIYTVAIAPENCEYFLHVLILLVGCI